MKAAGTLVIIILIITAILLMNSFYVVNPGLAGVKITLGTVDPAPLPSGTGLRTPFVTRIVEVPVKVQTLKFPTQCFSSDLQTVTATITVNYQFPLDQIVKLYVDYGGSVENSILKPRTQEAIKEVTAQRTAEKIVKEREQVKRAALDLLREKLGKIVTIDDLVLEDISLSSELEKAIEQKMVSEQKAAQARFTQDQTRIEAETAIIKAEGEAKSIKVIADALSQNPKILELRAVDKWNGVAPTTVVTGGANTVLPLATGVIKPTN